MMDSYIASKRAERARMHAAREQRFLDGISRAVAGVARYDENDVLTVTVQSQTDPSLTYTLHARNTTATCNCRGYQSFNHCKHQRALEAVLKEKS